jgi:hypothetical protein
VWQNNKSILSITVVEDLGLFGTGMNEEKKLREWVDLLKTTKGV